MEQTRIVLVFDNELKSRLYAAESYTLHSSFELLHNVSTALYYTCLIFMAVSWSKEVFYVYASSREFLVVK